MSGSSNIEWTDATWNPTRGCSMMVGSNSPECGGCYNCYAARQALRMAGPGGKYKGLVKLTPHGPRWTGKVVEGDLEAPLHWRVPRRVFVDSMSDLFHESLPDETIDRAFAVMALCPQHTFQVLTKRAERMERWVTHTIRVALPGGGSIAERLPLPNVWLGVSCENQATADARIPHLLKTPAAVRFVSLEPMLGPVDLLPWIGAMEHCCLRCGWEPIEGMPRYLEIHGDLARCICCDDPLPNRTLDWVILGGESGPGARPFDLAWACDVIAQCKVAGVPVFMKQLGEHWAREGQRIMPLPSDKWNRKGGNPAEWPEWARVREWPRCR